MKKYLAAFLSLLLFILLAGGPGFSLNALPAGGNQPTAPQLNVYALDIGQGDSLLIVSPTGKTVLIDTGNPGNEQIVMSALLNHAGGKKIDHFIASHPHADHIGSAPDVIKGQHGGKSPRQRLPTPHEDL
jgi:beta-lactamase superfamily II metal-dependent hydrolase